MTTRRKFLSTGAAFVSALPVFYGNAFCSQYNIDRAKVMYDPGRKLVRDGIEFAKKIKKTIPVRYSVRKSSTIRMLSSI